jgi:hypothetical protein
MNTILIIIICGLILFSVFLVSKYILIENFTNHETETETETEEIEVPLEPEEMLESTNLDDTEPDTPGNIGDDKNISYYEYPETFIELTGDALDVNKLYSGYSGTLNGQQTWNKMSLAECQDACNSMSNCVGFTRDMVDKNTESTCRPRTKIAQCHSSRKGNSSQRGFAGGYISYIKSNVKNQLNRCIGVEDLTLNRNICIKSMSKPFSYITADNNSISLQAFQNKGIDFGNKCKFLITKGLENSSTVSFSIMDNTGINYYLSDDGNNILSILPIDIKTSTLQQRTRASFELVDGIANEFLISFKTLASNPSDARYIMLTNPKAEVSRLSLVSLDTVNISPKDATFDIVDYITNTTIIQTLTPAPIQEETSSLLLNEPYENIYNANRKSKFNPAMRKSTGLDEFEDINDNDKINNAVRSLNNATKQSNRSSTVVKYDVEGENEAIDLAILKNNQLMNETNVLQATQQELKNWKNSVDNYNTIINNKKTDIQKKLNNINNMANSVELRDMAREYYFIKNKADSYSNMISSQS